MLFNRKMISLALAISLLAVINLFAQPTGGGRGGTISGKVLDSETKSPLSRANVSVISSTDSSVVTGGMSESDGKFEISSVRPGSYLVRVNYVGYSPYFSSEFAINRENRDIDLNIIALAQSSSQTDAVEIVADRQMMEYSQGKRVFNVDKNIASSGGTAIDILKNIPSVNVDVDGNVSLRGSTNMKVLINGKPTTMNPTVLMEQMPAESIESIEIITNPSARYDAEGMTGIINLVLKKNREQGLNGLVSLNIGTYDKYSFSINTAYQLNGLNLFANYDLGSRRMKATGESYRRTNFQDSSTLMEQTINRRHNSLNHTIRTGFDYQLGLLDQVSMSFMYRTGESSRTGIFQNTNKLTLDNSLLSETNRYSKETDKGPNYDYTFNYKHNFGDKGHDLTFDFSSSKSNDEEDTDYEESLRFPTQTDPFIENSSLNDVSSNMIFQTDYVYPIGDMKFESGAKITLQEMDGNYKHYYDSLGLFVDDLNKTNHFVYDEQIAAAYGIFSGKLDKFSYQLGLRAEASTINTDLRTTQEKKSRDYFNLFPSLSLSYKFTNFDELQLNFSRRINRPRSHYLNPFIDYSDPNNLRTGNPNIDPEFIDAYEIGYLKNFKLFSITPTLFYRKTYDKISYITELIAPGVFKTTFENLAEGTNYGIELNASFDFVKWMRLSTDFSYYRSEIKGAKATLELDNNDYSWSMRGNANFFFSKALSMQLIGNYTGPTVTPQGERYKMYFVDLGARYDILDRRATITFRLSDIFDTADFGGTSEGANFSTNYRMKRQSRVAFLGIQYKINEGPKQREKRRQQENGGGDFEEF